GRIVIRPLGGLSRRLPGTRPRDVRLARVHEAAAEVLRVPDPRPGGIYRGYPHPKAPDGLHLRRGDPLPGRPRRALCPALHPGVPMSDDLNDRLNKILDRVVSEDFLSGSGIGNEIAFYI